MRRPARGAGLQGPGEGRRALPCGTRSGLLCAVLCWASRAPVPTALPPSLLSPAFLSFLRPLPTSLCAPARAPGRCTAAPWNVFPCVPLE